MLIRPGAKEAGNWIKLFVFGNIGTGKSTLLAALVDFFIRADNLAFVVDHAELEGRRTALEWIQRIRNLEFPETSQSGKIMEVATGLVGNGFKIGIVLFEMSGEDLKKLSIIHGGSLDPEFEEALDSANVILALAPADTAKGHEILIGEFFNSLYYLKKTKPVALVVTKWDQLPKEYKNRNDEHSLDALLQSELKWPLSFLKLEGFIEDPAAFFFSVGTVVNGKISQYKPSGLEAIANWIVRNSIFKSAR